MSDALKVLFKPFEELEWSVGECVDFIVREREARFKADSALRQKDTFLAIVSHDLKNSLHLISGWLNLLRYGKFDEPLTNRAIESIERSIKLQTKLIEDLLDISQINNGKIRLNLQVIEIETLIENVIRDMQVVAQGKQIQITSRITPRLGYLTADPQRIEQILINLLSNAIKFTPAGGCILVCADQTISGVELKVTDTGRGIDAEFLPFIFEKFRQADAYSQGKQNGVGLGLFIVRQLVELHGGNVCSESAGIGKGTTFTLNLPQVLTFKDKEKENLPANEGIVGLF